MRLPSLNKALLCAVFVVSPLSASVSLAQHSGHVPCGHHGSRCLHHGRCHCLREAPYAPIFASAPAMMAPIVFTPVGPNAAMAPRSAAPDRDLLRELQELLSSQRPSAAPAERECNGNGNQQSAPLEAPQPPPDESIRQRLDRIDNQLGSLEKTLRSTAEAILKLDNRLRVLERE